MIALLLLAFAASLQAQQVTTFPVGTTPTAGLKTAAVNSATNTVYIIHNDWGLIFVVDGATKSTLGYFTSELGPYALAVNPDTGTVFIADNVAQSTTTVTAIIGSTATDINTGSASGATLIGTNRQTNMVYVGNSGSNDLTVLNGATNANVQIPLGFTPTALAVNESTNKVYILGANASDVSWHLLVLDGATNKTTSIPLPQSSSQPGASQVTAGGLALAVNPATNKIYVSGYWQWSITSSGYSDKAMITEIDGSTNATQPITIASGSDVTNPVSNALPAMLAVDSITNTIYGVAEMNNRVTLIDGDKRTATSVSGVAYPAALLVDEGNHSAYVSDSINNLVLAVNGSTSGTSSIPVGLSPAGLALNSATHEVYVMNDGDGTVSVIQGPMPPATTTTLTSDTNPANVGDKVTFTAYVAENRGLGSPSGNVNFLVDNNKVATVPLDSTQHASYSTSALTAGKHTVQASYAGATDLQGSSSDPLTETIQSVTAAPVFSPVGGQYFAAQNVILSDATSGAVIYFTTDGTTPTTASTKYTAPIPVSSTETIKAIAQAPGSAASEVSTATYTIGKVAPAITVTPASSSIASSQPLSVTVTVAAASGSSQAPTGTVTLSSGNYVSQPVALGNGGAQFTIPSGALTSGTNTLTAAYTPDAAASSIYENATGTATVAVKSTPVVTVVPSSYTPGVLDTLSVTVAVSGGTGNPVPTGTVTLNGGSYSSSPATVSSAGTTFSIPAGSLPAGKDVLIASYTPDSNSSDKYNSGSGSATVNVSAVSGHKVTPTVTVTPSSASVSTTDSLSVTVAVSGGTGNPAATGTVTLSSGSYSSQAEPLSSGNVTIKIPAGSLQAGSDTLQASYSPDQASQGAYNAATGTASVTVGTAPQPPITVSNSGSISVDAGSTTGNTSTITLAPIAGGFTGTVALSCAVTTAMVNPVDPPTCSVPSSVDLSGTTPETVTVTVKTTPPPATASAALSPTRLLSGSSALLALLFCFRIRRREWGVLLGLFLLVITIGAVGCSSPASQTSASSGSGKSGTTPGTYTVTITATAANAVQSTSFGLTIK